MAPGFLEGSLDVLTARESLRLLVVAGPRPSGVEFREISGGVLAQQADRLDAPGDDAAAWRLTAGEQVDERTLADLLFAWRADPRVKSNAILLARGRAASGSAWARSTASTPPGSRCSGPATGRPARWRPRTPTSRSRTG